MTTNGIKSILTSDEIHDALASEFDNPRLFSPFAIRAASNGGLSDLIAEAPQMLNLAYDTLKVLDAILLMAIEAESAENKKSLLRMAIEAISSTSEDLERFSIKPNHLAWTLHNLKYQPTTSKNNLGISDHDSSAVAQRTRLLTYLRLGSITTLQARRSIDVMHPAARIQELRRQGNVILTIRTQDYTAEGHPHRVAKYILVPSDNDAQISMDFQLQ